MSTVAVFIALGGVSYAAIALPVNSVGSKQIKKGAVKKSDLGKSAVATGKVKNGSLLSIDFKPGQLVAGAPGATGPKGDPGTNGAPATALWAVVGPTGTLARGSHVVSTSRPSTGVYAVIFDRGVAGCAFLAGVGGPGNVTFSGEVSASRSISAPANGVTVVRRNSAGAVVNQPFHLAVFC